MPALAPGSAAPDFDLTTVSGGRFSLREALAQRPVLAVFFKISCPVCQYALPFFERIHRAYGSNVEVIAISQNEAKHTAAFNQEYGITFPVLLDDTNEFPVSNAYGLTNVPTFFWIAQSGEIEVSSVGWSREDVQEANARAAAIHGAAPAPLFQPDESVPEFRAG